MKKLLREPFFWYSVVCWSIVIVCLATGVLDWFASITCVFFWLSTLGFEIRKDE